MMLATGICFYGTVLALALLIVRLGVCSAVRHPPDNGPTGQDQDNKSSEQKDNG